MRLFDPRDRHVTPAQAKRYALFELFHTAVDFSAAICFVLGSVLFFFNSTETAAIICFVIGSVFFAAKPSIRLARELWLFKAHKAAQPLAKQAPEAPGNLRVTDNDSASQGKD